jgi:hypothetical protein
MSVADDWGVFCGQARSVVSMSPLDAVPVEAIQTAQEVSPRVI